MAKKKPKEPEYTLHVFHHVSELSRKPGVLFVVQTVKEFGSFHYEVVLSGKREQNTVELSIEGLNTPTVVMPGQGSARGKRFFEGLQGRFDLKIRKPNGNANEFGLEVLTETIRVTSSPPHPFVRVILRPPDE